MNHNISFYIYNAAFIFAGICFFLYWVRPEAFKRNLIALGLLLCCIGVLFIFNGCVTAPTPEQVQAWANVGHTVVHNGLIDAKDVMTVVQ